ncbi:MAG: hypothetical protein WC044_14630 [Crocinitomicaceae bacterium]
MSQIITHTFGKVFPANVTFVGYLLFGLSFFIFTTSILGGIFVLLLAFFIAFTDYGTALNLRTKTIREFTKYFGFIPLGKDKSYSGHRFITAIPSKQSIRMYSRATTGTIVTDYFYLVCVYNEKYQARIEVAKFDSREEAIEVAKKMAPQMELEYFDYDPRNMRDRLMGLT